MMAFLYIDISSDLSLDAGQFQQKVDEILITAHHVTK
jgi:hypothetical protein